MSDKSLEFNNFDTPRLLTDSKLQKFFDILVKKVSKID